MSSVKTLPKRETKKKPSQEKPGIIKMIQWHPEEDKAKEGSRATILVTNEIQKPVSLYVIQEEGGLYRSKHGGRLFDLDQRIEIFTG